MGLLSVTGIAAASFILLKMWEMRLERGQTPRGVWAVVVYSLTSFARTVALVAVVTYVFLLSAIVVARFVSPVTVAELGAYISTAQAMRDVVIGLAGVWSVIVFVSIFVGLFVLVFLPAWMVGADEFANSKREGGAVRTVLGLVVSRGMLAMLDRGSKTVLAVGLVLLCFALVGVSGDAVGKSMQDRMLLPLERLYLAASEEEARQSYEEALLKESSGEDDDTSENSTVVVPEPPLEPVEPWEPLGFSGGDDVTLNSLAIAFEEAVGGAIVAHRSVNIGANLTLRGLRARQGIVDVFGDARSSSVRGAGRLSDVGGLSTVEREAVELYETSEGETGPRTSLGRRFLRDLKATIARWSDAPRRRVADARASFGKQASVAELESRAVAQMLGGVLDVGGPPTSVLEGMGREFAENAGGNVVEHIYQTGKSSALESLIKGKGVKEAFREVGDRLAVVTGVTRGLMQTWRRATQKLPRVEEMVAKLAERPPSIQAKGELNVAEDQLRGALDRYARAQRVSGESGGVEVPNAVTEFDDLFPSGSAQSGSLRSLVAQEPGFVASNEAARRSAFERARSYERLRGFTKIGGVLIGRPPNGTVGDVEFVSLDWRDAGKGEIVLEFGRADGARVDVGPYTSSLVAQALAYAADGRPVAVTMVSAKPLPDLRVLLHPALLDTPLGCRIIELDRFVDRFTWDLTNREELVERARAQGVLYEWAWAVRLLNAIDRDLIARDDLTQEVAVRLYQALSTLAENLESKELVMTKVLKHPSILVGSRGSFDKKLLAAMADCRGGSFDEWVSCVGDRSVRDSSAAETWLRLPRRFEVWSGVREAPYRLDANLEFQELTEGELTPLRFMLQAAFEEDENGESGEPWEFTELEDEIARAVEAGVGSSSEYSETLVVARQFTALQRLFRSALEGGLGQEFPVERLVELAEVTAVEIGEMRTLRWTPKGAQLDAVLSRLSDELNQVSYEVDEWNDGVTKLRSCLAELSDSRSVPGPRVYAACSFGEHRTRVLEACDQRDEEACSLKALLSAVDELVSAVEMRVVLGVTEDERLLREGRFESCAEVGR